MRGNRRCASLRPWMPPIALAVWLPGAAACTSSTEIVYASGAAAITTSALILAPGDSITVTLTNSGATTLFVSPCPTYLEHETRSGWVQMGTAAELFSQAGCDATGAYITPGASIVIARRLPSVLPAGTYRIRFEGFRTTLGPAVLRPEYHISNHFRVE